MDYYFINEYQYTPEILSEGMEAWWHKRLKKGYRDITVMVILIALSFFLTWKLWILALEILPLFNVVLFQKKKKNAIKIEKERLKVLFKDTVPVFRVEIGEEIRMTTSNGEKHVSFADVEDLVETEHLFVLLIKGNMTISLDKRCFLRGDEVRCREYLEERIYAANPDS